MAEFPLTNAQRFVDNINAASVASSAVDKLLVDEEAAVLTEAVLDRLEAIIVEAEQNVALFEAKAKDALETFRPPRSKHSKFDEEWTRYREDFAQVLRMHEARFAKQQQRFESNARDDATSRDSPGPR